MPTDQVVQRAFDDGKPGDYLTQLRVNAIHGQVDVLEHDMGGIILSNPGFTKRTNGFTQLQTNDSCL